MNISLDTLLMTGPELTTEQLDEVDGGMVEEIVICGVIVVCVAAIGILCYNIGYHDGQEDAQKQP